MGRIKLEINGHLIYKTSLKVRISDINYGNHVGNDSFISMIHEARIQWLKTKGYDELDIEGAGLIMSDLVIEFKQECFYGEQIDISLFAGEVSKVSFDLYYAVQTIRSGSEILLVKAKTGMVCYNYQQKKVTRVPQIALAKFSGH